jgi:hypothetical protein
MSILRWLINILLITLPAIAYGQKDTTRLSFKKYYLPTGVRIGTDAISLSRNFYDESFKGWEGNIDVDFHRYFLTVDYGNWERSYEREDRLKYTNNGNYFRVGADVNFLTKDPDRNMFFVGGRYGHSNFDEYFYLVDYENDVGYERPYYNTNVPAHWFELTTGVRVKIWSALWMGYTARFKFGLQTGDTPEMLPHDVPGYGRTDKESYWGFNYQIMIRIPVRKAPPLPPAKKKKKRT